MNKIKLYWLISKEWIISKYTSGKAIDLLNMVGIGICVIAVFSVLLY